MLNYISPGLDTSYWDFTQEEKDYYFDEKRFPKDPNYDPVKDPNRRHRKIESNIGIRVTDFIKPPVADPEITVSERISLLDRETENCLLINPEKSILGFSAVRIELESYIIIKIQDKMRQHIRMKDGNNDRDVKFTSKLKTKHVFDMIKELFPQRKEEYDALNTIYRVSSRTVHRALPYSNYLSWGSLAFVLDKLKNMIDNLDPNDTRLQTIITKLKNEGIIRVVTSTWYIP